jgi:hypothetical protein
VLEHVGRSWYDELGEFNPLNDNYFAGNTSFKEYRNFFVFDLSSIDGEILSMQLEVFNPRFGYFSNDPSETYGLFDVSTDPQDLIAGIGGIPAFVDMGTGVSYGTHVATLVDEGTFIIIPLNAFAVADADAMAGGLWAIGGAITTLDNEPETAEGTFGGSANSPNTRLVLTVGAACFPVFDEQVTCHPDGETFTYTVQGVNSCTGATQTFSFTASGGAVGEQLCFTLLVDDGGFCCTTVTCVTIPDCTPECDLDGDGIVGMVDFLALLGAWGSCSDCGTCPADFDGDCTVGILDLLVLLGNWS